MQEATFQRSKPLSVDRRLRRSLNHATALRFQLEHSCLRGGLTALVFADSDGLIVAAAGESQICAELGAVAPLVARAHRVPSLDPKLHEQEVVIRGMRLHGRDFFLACAGGGVARDAFLQHALEGIHRILTSN